MTSEPLRVALSGATGRMGLRLTRLLLADARFALVGASCSPQDPRVGEDVARMAGLPPCGVELTGNVAAMVRRAQVVVDFSTSEATSRVCGAALALGVPAVVGTTALTPFARAAVEALSRKAPVVWAANTSVGVVVLARVMEEAIQLLGEGFDVEVTELHHRGKIDAPSGTARMLAERGIAALGRSGRGVVSQRAGLIGARVEGTVGISAQRGGDAVGEHSVLLLGDGERLELTHRATDRDVFARGALRAALWVTEPQRQPGIYGMEAVLGLVRDRPGAESAGPDRK